MTTTVARPVGWRHFGGADSVTRKVAEALGCTPAGAQQRLWGTCKVSVTELAEIVRVCRAAGRMDVADRLLRPLLAALGEAHPLRTLAEALRDARDADAAEDATETRYLLSRDRTGLDAELKAVEREIREKLALRDALIAQRAAL